MHKIDFIYKIIKKGIHLNKDGTLKYDYSLIPEKFKNTDKIFYICPIHGQIDEPQLVCNHLKGAGCKKCSIISIQKHLSKPKLNKTTFIKDMELLHQKEDGTPKYDYSLIPEIFYSKDNIKLYCKTCKKYFEISVVSHKQGHGCKICGYISRANKNRKPVDKFISEAKQIHKNSDGTPKYDYSQVNKTYYDNETLVNIGCNIIDEFTGEKHGYFKQTPHSHLSGSGCPLCGIKKKRNTKEKFLQLSKEKFNKNFKFDLSNFDKMQGNQIIGFCEKHGKFIQTPHSHLISEYGCPYCASEIKHSKAENEIAKFLKSFNFEIKLNVRNILTPQEIDIFIPSKNVGIEYNGLYWHAIKEKYFHYNKTLLAEKKGIQLIHIFEDEWIEKQEIVKARLLNLLGKNKWSIGARKCKIKQVPVEEERVFLNNNHLQGYVASTVCYGLYWTRPETNKEYLVALMSFGPLRKNLGSSNQEGCYELYRFVTMKNFSIPGGASKLFKHFIKKFSPKQIISFADRRWSIRSEKNLYEQLGFKFDSYTQIGYYYTYGKKRLNRFSLRKDLGISKFDFHESMTEEEIANNLGYYKIYDCGQLKYIWNDISVNK